MTLSGSETQVLHFGSVTLTGCPVVCTWKLWFEEHSVKHGIVSVLMRPNVERSVAIHSRSNKHGV